MIKANNKEIHCFTACSPRIVKSGGCHCHNRVITSQFMEDMLGEPEPFNPSVEFPLTTDDAIPPDKVDERDWL